MAMDLIHKNFWELSPYCYCRNRNWLTIDDVNIVTIPLEGEDKEEIAAVASGLSRDDTALLAAFLTALALFLFLLFLLLCCLFPWGLCCGGKDDACCAGACGGKQKKKKDAFISSTDSSSGGSVNLTALDMKIPRPWMDTQDGYYSDSEMERSRRFYGTKDMAETSLDRSDQRTYANEAYQKDSFFQDGGWFSTSDLDSVYGSGGGGGGGGSQKKRERRRRRSFDDTGSATGSLRVRQYDQNQHLSRSVDNLDSLNLMTYYPHHLHGSRDVMATSYARSYGNYGGVSGGSRDDVRMTTSRYNGDGVDGATAGAGTAGSIVEELKLTKTRTLNLPPTSMQIQATGQQQQPQHERVGEFPSVTSPMPYMESTNQNMILPRTDDNQGMMIGHNSTGSSSFAYNQRPRDDDVISEYKAYKRVTKETTTTTTTE